MRNRSILQTRHMAKNDTILIDGILDERIGNKHPSDQRDEVFEFFAIEQALKDADLSNEEILQGIVDGQHDGLSTFAFGQKKAAVSVRQWPLIKI